MANFDLAITMQQRCFELSKEVFGLDHPNSLTFAANLCVDLQKNGSQQDALSFLDEIDRTLESSDAPEKIRQEYRALRAPYLVPK